MSTSVLEIGPADNPAILLPGSVFQSGEVQYTGLEPRREEAQWVEEHDSDDLKLFDGEIKVGDSAEIDFPDKTFDYVISRSVFGEYTMPPGFTGSSQLNTEHGIYEAFRVLKDDGELVLAEENTPYKSASATRVACFVLSAGFEDITIFPCQNLENPEWEAARTRFWDMYYNDLGNLIGKPIDPQLGYLLQAKRPHSDTISFEALATDNEIRKANIKRGWNHPDNIPSTKMVTLQKSAKPLPVIPDDPFGKFRQVSIVTAEGTIDLGSYLENPNDLQSSFLLA